MIENLTLLHVIMSSLLLYSQFCRAVKMDGSCTHLSVILAFYFLTAASIFSLFAPVVVPGWRPSLEMLLLLASTTVVQLVTSRYWKHGTPKSFSAEASHGSQLG